MGEEIREGGKRIGFDIVSLDGARAPLARTSGGFRGPKVGKYTVALDDFERIAGAALHGLKVASADVVVIDEIGKMECFSRRFQSLVRAVYATGKSILSTIPLGTSHQLPLVAELCDRGDGNIVTVTKDNRDELRNSLLQMLAQNEAGQSQNDGI